MPLSVVKAHIKIYEPADWVQKYMWELVEFDAVVTFTLPSVPKCE